MAFRTRSCAGGPPGHQQRRHGHQEWERVSSHHQTSFRNSRTQTAIRLRRVQRSTLEGLVRTGTLDPSHRPVSPARLRPSLVCAQHAERTTAITRDPFSYLPPVMQSSRRCIHHHAPSLAAFSEATAYSHINSLHSNEGAVNKVICHRRRENRRAGHLARGTPEPPAKWRKKLGFGAKPRADNTERLPERARNPVTEPAAQVPLPQAFGASGRFLHLLRPGPDRPSEGLCGGRGGFCTENVDSRRHGEGPKPGRTQHCPFDAPNHCWKMTRII